VPDVDNSHKAHWITATRTGVVVAVFTRSQFGRAVATLYCAAEQCHEEPTVANKTMPCAENNELIDTFTKRGSKCSGDALTLLGSADVYGGGSEYFRFWRLPLSPFSWIPFLAQWRARLELCQWRAKTLYSEPGSPWENGHCESFNSKLRDEFLNPEIFYSMKELRVLERWRIHYNTVRPHFSLGYRPPAPETWMTSTSKGHGEVETASRFPLPQPRRRLLELRSNCAKPTHPTVQKTGQSTKR
jgi:hypothetical protein